MSAVKSRITVRRSVALALAIPAVVFGVGTATVTPALAAGCYAASCNNQDPSAMGCAGDARDISTYWINVDNRTHGLLRLRYSPACNAVWLRWDPTGTGYRVVMSVWHPGSPSVESPAMAGQGYWKMLSRPGQVCYGAQVYDSWLNWRAWRFAGCV